MPPADEVSRPSRCASLPPGVALALECLWHAWREDPDPGLRKAIQHAESELRRRQAEREGDGDASTRAGCGAEPQEAVAPGARNLTFTLPSLPLPDATLHSVHVHSGSARHVLAMTSATEIGELADKAAAALGLPPGPQYTLMHDAGAGVPAMLAVHRLETLGALAAEDGHEARRYVLLACA
jgi:hypothetical protein